MVMILNYCLSSIYKLIGHSSLDKEIFEDLARPGVFVSDGSFDIPIISLGITRKTVVHFKGPTGQFILANYSHFVSIDAILIVEKLRDLIPSLHQDGSPTYHVVECGLVVFHLKAGDVLGGFDIDKIEILGLGGKTQPREQ
jgi:hypothetical protein